MAPGWPSLSTDGMGGVSSRVMGKEGMETEHRQLFCRTFSNWKQRNVAKQGCAMEGGVFFLMKHNFRLFVYRRE